MTFREKQLYHQIHPLKLGTDISAAIISTYFFWIHAPLWLCFVRLLLPPIAISTIMLKTMAYSRIKISAIGRYLKRSMTPSMETLRLFGTVPMALGAWYHQPWAIVLGIVIILFGWLRGLIFPPRRRVDAPPSL